MFFRASFIHLVSSEPLQKKVCSCPARLLHNRLLYLQLLFPSHPLWYYMMGHRQGLILFMRGGVWELSRDIISVYQGKERKYKIYLGKETSFSKCSGIWYFCFCYFWMCTWRWHGFQSHRKLLNSIITVKDPGYIFEM